MSGNELGLFLRSRRESVTPVQVGLPTGARRRTPGLRRSELATLAGVSVEYLTRLEQGRDRRPSAAVLATLADALRLGTAERMHLHRLTKEADPGFRCRGDVAPSSDVRPTVRALLDRLEPTPAVVLNRRTDILAWTEGYRRLMAPAGLDPTDAANLTRFVFTEPRARAFYPDWSHVADETVARLKQGPFRNDPHIAAFADELTLTAGAEFADRAESVPSLAPTSGITRLAHPDAGPLRLSYEVLELAADDDAQLLVQLPADEASAAALDRLAGLRSGALRAVSG
ncbi:helix-turn-helix transcriptional regulator [Aldersonia sp. NBC_00410]|uniref:helix-turn-helix domain-containing protein n=1 Tax=Aldersonia sp. NBC_00410 TaxID=2975954 RepID=UPI002254DBE9|nr:helix-turn-helix transcriptional regulator [Aldersonia sp. NBC_00410]MCX5044632.1 helix-turn-helix transcriptional regulator [Aldersonia sp. NBC_00410]